MAFDPMCGEDAMAANEGNATTDLVGSVPEICNVAGTTNDAGGVAAKGNVATGFADTADGDVAGDCAEAELTLAHPNRDFMSTVAVLMVAVNCNKVGRKTTDMLQDGHDRVDVEGVE